MLTHHCQMLPTGSTWIRRYHTVPWAARPIQNIGWIPRDLGFGDTSKRSKIDMLTRKIRKQKQAINCPRWQRPISRKKQTNIHTFWLPCSTWYWIDQRIMTHGDIPWNGAPRIESYFPPSVKHIQKNKMIFALTWILALQHQVIMLITKTRNETIAHPAKTSGEYQLCFITLSDPRDYHIFLSELSVVSQCQT